MRHVGAIVLAAGASTRLGTPKQLLRFRGETLVRRAARSVQEAGCTPVVVVSGHLREPLEPELQGLKVDIVPNEQWQRGLGTSIRSGLEAILARNPQIEGVVLLACDQPFVDANTIEQLIKRWCDTAKHLVASSYAETAGIPALFGRACFDLLLALPDDSGAKSLIRAHGDNVALVPFARGAIDIDTPGDLRHLSDAK